MTTADATFDRQATAEAQTQGARDVLAERWRQIHEEGFGAAFDDRCAAGTLSRAAAAYALHNPSLWPPTFLRYWWKPSTPRRDLVRAAALIIAEIDRMDRAAAVGAQSESGASGDRP